MLIETKNIAQKEFERPIPDFSNVGVYVKKNPTKLKLSKIHIDDKLGNTARMHGTSEKDNEN